ncbi:MAG: response regulator [Deltaproteobacteria bacterium]|nr:response regulator [Deltaproteobacteria bacterium]
MLRRITVRALRRLGYQVTEAGDGVEAQEIWQRRDGAFDLLLADMVLPNGLSGLKLSHRLREQKAALKTIIASGYSAELARIEDVTAAGLTYLPKPFDLETLARKVRACLDGRT